MKTTRYGSLFAVLALAATPAMAAGPAEGIYHIEPKLAPGKCLIGYGGTDPSVEDPKPGHFSAEMDKVQLHSCADTKLSPGAFKWRLIDAGNGQYRMKYAGSGKCAGLFLNFDITPYACDHKQVGLWTIEKAGNGLYRFSTRNEKGEKAVMQVKTGKSEDSGEAWSYLSMDEKPDGDDNALFSLTSGK